MNEYNELLDTFAFLATLCLLYSFDCLWGWESMAWQGHGGVDDDAVLGDWQCHG